LIDTAGLNPTPAELERRGIAKTMERAAEADLFLLVLDATAPAPALPPPLASRIDASNTIVVLNKIDLPPGGSVAAPPAGLPIVRISALTGQGLDELRTAVGRHADSFRNEVGEELVAINARHADALARAKASLQDASAKLTDGTPDELLASDLRGALSAYGEISGKIDNERMLDELFATFCIGK
jgi:tRNA modification GTPase